MICVDTNVLIWGVQGAARAAQIGMVDRTRRFLRWLFKANDLVMVPAVVVSEYLHNFPAFEHARQLRVLEENFVISPFDIRCAAVASEMQSAGRVTVGVPGARQTLKADTQIIATAICHGARAIVTADVAEFFRLAKGRIAILDVPDIWERPHMSEHDCSETGV
jgi:predicted nucleic acid-binding protein